MPDFPNDGTAFRHFPCYDDWSFQQEDGATIDNYLDALHQHADDIKFKRQYPEDAFEVFEYLAHVGHLAGMYSYGYSIMHSQGTDDDRTEGFAWVEESASLGFSRAQRQLAAYLSKGIGCERNGVEALRWAQAAIDQGFVDAHSTIETIHMDGDGVPVDQAKGIEHYFLGMNAGSVECIRQVGTGVEKDINKAVELYEKAVSLGSGLAYYYLGEVYEAGDDGVPKDPSKAAMYFKQGDELADGSCAAMLGLAFLYEDVIGVEQSYELSLHYYLEAAKFEDSWALHALGRNYAHGTGVEQDYTKAFEFFERAARQNLPAAIIYLGYLLGKGQGCAKDLVRAAQFHQQAAALGDGAGAKDCGILFQYGGGVPIDLFKAVDYFRIAVRLKYDIAKEYLGPAATISRDLYSAGRVLEAEAKDKEALDHYVAAAVQGHSGAIASVASMFRNAAGLGRVSLEKEPRYFEPLEVSDSTLSSAPNELLIRIFQWLHPKECILLRHISRRIGAFFEDESVSRHLFKFHSVNMPSRHMSEGHWFDEMLFHGPHAFQAAYLGMKVNGLQALRLQHRKYASLRDNKLNVFPATFSKWTSLTSVQLSNSGLVGVIPDSIKHLRYLKELVLSCNRFNGTKIPPSIMELTHLEVLMLKDCGLIGTLYKEFRLFLKTLKRYSLRNNQLEIPGPGRIKWSHNGNVTKYKGYA
ncbi:hypothetical protein HDU81_000608 [Chytriomyces hyalinus]|nr:hypothetical protein HDU81_000608 [Chytriomyces hyalinus]